MVRFLLVLFIFAQSFESALELARPLICGHRGGFYPNYPENSLAAIDHTVGNVSSAVVVEFDLRRSKDGTLFLMHDQTVDRTTNGQGNLSDLTDAYIQSLFLKTSSGALLKEKVPTYDQLLDFAASRNVLLMFDTKGDVWEEAIRKLGSRNLLQKSLFLTFTPADTQRVYSLSKDVRISALIKAEKDWAAIRSLSIPAQRLVAYVDRNTDRSLIEKIRSVGIPVMADVSENAGGRTAPFPPEHYRRMVEEMQLDILITDYPVDAFSALKR